MRPDQCWRWRSSRRDTAQMGDEVKGGPPDTQNFWQRFSSQETGPQRLVVGLAGTVTAVATAIGGVYTVTNVVGGDESADRLRLDNPVGQRPRSTRRRRRRRPRRLRPATLSSLVVPQRPLRVRP